MAGVPYMPGKRAERPYISRVPMQCQNMNTTDNSQLGKKHIASISSINQCGRFLISQTWRIILVVVSLLSCVLFFFFLLLWQFQLDPMNSIPQVKTPFCSPSPISFSIACLGGVRMMMDWNFGFSLIKNINAPDQKTKKGKKRNYKPKEGWLLTSRVEIR